MKRSGFKTKQRKPLNRTTRLKAKPRKRRQKTELQKLKARLWELCREITRKRYGNVCYTCGLTGLAGGNWQTGHFVSSSICSTALRYDLRNLRPQCYACNINKSGNWLAYEIRLTAELGPSFVVELKAENERTKGVMYREEWYQAKIAEYETL